MRELRISHNRIDRMFYLAVLKDIGKIGQQLYKLRADDWLKKFLINLHKQIQEYEHKQIKGKI